MMIATHQSAARQKYAQLFPGAHALLPVIHALSVEQTLRNTGLAKQLGADGIFLISYRLSYLELFRIYAKVRATYPGFWVGINAVDLRGISRYELIPHGVDGIWVDDVAIKEEFATPQLAAERTKARLARPDAPLFFGGVAFKYPDEVHSLGLVTSAALAHVDVLITSGPGTGKPPHMIKLDLVRSAGGDVPIAVTTGITPANIRNYLATVDAFLVASSICDEAEDIIPARLASLRAQIPT